MTIKPHGIRGKNGQNSIKQIRENCPNHLQCDNSRENFANFYCLIINERKFVLELWKEPRFYILSACGDGLKHKRILTQRLAHMGFTCHGPWALCTISSHGLSVPVYQFMSQVQTSSHPYLWCVKPTF